MRKIHLQSKSGFCIKEIIEAEEVNQKEVLNLAKLYEYLCSAQTISTIQVSCDTGVAEKIKSNCSSDTQESVDTIFKVATVAIAAAAIAVVVPDALEKSKDDWAKPILLTVILVTALAYSQLWWLF